MGAIFKRDFRALFLSPVGYVFGGIFIALVNGLFYVLNIIVGQTADTGTVFSMVLLCMAFLIPILTMRLMSEEMRQKTDQLLLTSPVNVSSIITGKFLAAFASFAVMLMGTLLIPAVEVIFGVIEPWVMLGNYVAILAAAAAFIAIGLFISSMTENQLIAAILSWAIFIGMFVIDIVVASVDVSAITFIFSWTSIYKRFSSFASGIFSLSDFIFYISLTVVFLFITVRMIEKKRYS